MPLAPLPAPLEENAQTRWGAILEAIQDRDLTLPDPGRGLAEIKRAMILSDFITQQCLRNPPMWCELLQSGDLYRINGDNGLLNRLQDQ